MLKINHRYATALLEFAEEYGLNEIYFETLNYLLGGQGSEMPAVLKGFLAHVPGGKGEVEAVLYTFLDMAREQMNLLHAEVISAVPLSPEQIAVLEKKLIGMFHKQIEMTVTVNPSILAGLRVIVDDKVLDDSVKRKLLDMKQAVYEGVYSSL